MLHAEKRIVVVTELCVDGRSTELTFTLPVEGGIIVLALPSRLPDLHGQTHRRLVCHSETKVFSEWLLFDSPSNSVGWPVRATVDAQTNTFASSSSIPLKSAC
jgi:hypothetical protein